MDRLQRRFLGEWDLIRNVNYEEFLTSALKKRSRWNANEWNLRSGLDQMANVICFEKWFENSFHLTFGEDTKIQQE
jgi:hypothetical protein